jgi:hypothetical protein
MIQSAGDFDAYVFSKQPNYNEKRVRREFAKAVPCEPSSSTAMTRAPSGSPPR